MAHFEGISRIQLKSKSRSLLSHRKNINLIQIDGLYFYNNSLVAIQHDNRMGRVIRLYLNKKLNKVKELKVLESGNSLFNIPTTGFVLGNELFYIANSQLTSFRNGKILPSDDLHEILIYKVRL